MKDRLGDKFTDKEFFKAYLDVGPAPFNMIEEKLDAWAQAQ